MKKQKQKKLIIILSIIGAALLVLGILIDSYNNLVEEREEVVSAQSEISNQLQRRADLIPNFVSTVKGYSDYEKETYTAVTEARSAVQSADSVAEQADASQRLDRAISIWVNAVTEAYPDLEANAQYIALQDELAGTENRIAQARKDYNEDVQEFNTEIKKFPRVLVAKLFGFDSYEYFEADFGAESVPQVSFD